MGLRELQNGRADMSQMVAAQHQVRAGRMDVARKREQVVVCQGDLLKQAPALRGVLSRKIAAVSEK